MQDRVRIKICCIASVQEAALAARHGAAAVGLVSSMPSGPGVIPDNRIAEIAPSVPPGVKTFLLTSLVESDAIVEQQRRCRASTVQVCDRVAPAVRRELHRRMPGVSIVQVVHVHGPQSVAEAIEAAETADALLLDSGDQDAAIKELGGTGRTHDWDTSARIVKKSSVPVYLAGGLRSENVEAAIRTVRPFAVDVCSGVRTDGCLDEDRLVAFVDAVRAASETLRSTPRGETDQEGGNG